MIDCHYSRDCLPIVAASQASVEIFQRAAIFTSLTIRQLFVTIPLQMADVELNGVESRFLFGPKRDAWRYIAANRESLWHAARSCHAGQIDLDSLVLEFLAIPGLGIVKASFLAQLTTGQGACIDAHNLRELGLDETAFRLSKKLTFPTIRKRIQAYNAVWRCRGDSAYWWNLWCDGVASRRPAWFASARECSASHRVIL